MKNLIITLCFIAFLISCEKEVFSKKEKQFSNKEIECLFIVENDLEFSGYADFYVGGEKIYSEDFLSVNLQDTIKNGFSFKILKIKQNVTFAELQNSDGWFHINLFLDKEVKYIMNINYIDGYRALNNHNLFPEFSDKEAYNSDYLFNSFVQNVKKIKKPKGVNLMNNL